MAMASIVIFGIYKMKPARIQKMMMHNGSFIGILLVSSIALIKIKKRIDLAKKKRLHKEQIESLRNRLFDKDE